MFGISKCRQAGCGCSCKDYFVDSVELTRFWSSERCLNIIFRWEEGRLPFDITERDSPNICIASTEFTQNHVSPWYTVVYLHIVSVDNLEKQRVANT